MATDAEIRQQTPPPGPKEQEAESVPLSLLGKWIAWSSDGMRIVAAAETIEEAERLAAEAGEPEPMFQRHVKRGFGYRR